MDLAGEYRIAAAPEAVWAALNDPVLLQVCIDGCQSLDCLSPTEFKARVSARIGPVQATFAGLVTLSDRDPPRGYTITGKGEGGVAGFVRGSARVSLEQPEPGVTLLRFEARAEVGGKLASVGSRLVRGVAQKTADGFFTRLAAALAPAPIPSTPMAGDVPVSPGSS